MLPSATNVEVYHGCLVDSGGPHLKKDALGESSAHTDLAQTFMKSPPNVAVLLGFTVVV